MASRIDSESPSKALRRKAEASSAPPVPTNPMAPGSPPKPIPKRGPERAAAEPEPERPEEQEPRLIRRGLFGQMPAWAISMLLHIVVLLVMALMAGESVRIEKPTIITSSISEETAEEFSEFEEPSETPIDAPEVSEPVADMMVTADVVVTPVEVAAMAVEVEAAPPAVELTEFGDEQALASDMVATIGVAAGAPGGFAGRANPGRMAATGGGSAGSETAVDAALKWFAAHQLPNGSWTALFDECPSCKGKCRNSARPPSVLPANVLGFRTSSVVDPAGSTALALLPFLGRGYTHQEGPYKQAVERGLAHLVGVVRANKGRAYDAAADHHGGYVQALTAMVLSEAYGMSQDPELVEPAQLALNFIRETQDSGAGGWRYSPAEAGSTPVTSFMIMALKSGHMAKLQIDLATIQKASAFLDSTASDSGSQYGYWGNTPVETLAPPGVLCRMYLGWAKEQEGIKLAVMRFATKGPDPQNMYYNYYVTQVMHHYGGDPWLAWNARMRDMLVATQAKEGHEAGSWHFPIDHNAGRLWVTALSTMILEVYYRHMPLYSDQSVGKNF
jgi:hypothetical protein